jgi:Rod binding domain-containing protein
MTSAPAQSPALALAAQHRHEALVQQTQKWVAQSFYGTMLKQASKSPFHSDLFDGGRGGQVFHEMLDQQLAEHMSRGAAPRLVDSIVRKIEGGRARSSYQRQSNWPDIANQMRSHVLATG